MKIATFRLHTASLLEAMRSTGHAWSYKAWCSAGISCFPIALIGAFRSFPFSLSDLLPRRSAVARLSCRYVFYRGHPRFWNFYSTIPVDVVWVKSYINCLFGSARVVIRVMITKLYFEFVPEWLVSGVVGILWNGGTGKSDVSIVLLNSVLYRSSSRSDVYLAAFTGNPVNDAILCSRVDGVLRSHWDLSVVSDLKVGDYANTTLQATLKRSKVYVWNATYWLKTDASILT